MSKGIITEIQFIETCPAPECNLSDQDIEQFVEEFDSYVKLFEPAFRRREQWRWSRLYVQGLLGPTQRKTVERMALELGQNVRDMQHFVGQSPWRKEAAGVIHQGLVAETLGKRMGSC
jgi:SRSO17 transposase